MVCVCRTFEDAVIEEKMVVVIQQQPSEMRHQKERMSLDEEEVTEHNRRKCKHRRSHSGDNSRPGTPLCDERPDYPGKHETFPLFSNSLMSLKPTPPSPPPSSPSPPPRPPSSSPSEDSEPSSPSATKQPTDWELRLKSLDEKYEKWSGCRMVTTHTKNSDPGGQKVRHKLLDLNVHELQPSDIVKSVLAKRSIFDEDSKRLENMNDKYEPKDYIPSRIGLQNYRSYLTPLSAPVVNKGLQYPFPSHPHVVNNSQPQLPINRRDVIVNHVILEPSNKPIVPMPNNIRRNSTNSSSNLLGDTARRRSREETVHTSQQLLETKNVNETRISLENKVTETSTNTTISDNKDVKAILSPTELNETKPPVPIVLKQEVIHPVENNSTVTSPVETKPTPVIKHELPSDTEIKVEVNSNSHSNNTPALVERIKSASIEDHKPKDLKEAVDNKPISTLLDKNECNKKLNHVNSVLSPCIAPKPKDCDPTEVVDSKSKEKDIERDRRKSKDVIENHSSCPIDSIKSSSPTESLDKVETKEVKAEKKEVKHNCVDVHSKHIKDRRDTEKEKKREKENVEVKMNNQRKDHDNKSQVSSHDRRSSKEENEEREKKRNNEHSTSKQHKSRESESDHVTIRHHNNIARKEKHKSSSSSRHNKDEKKSHDHEEKRRDNHEESKRKDVKENHEELKRKDSHDESKRKENHDENKKEESHEEVKRKDSHEENKRKHSHDESKRKETHEDLRRQETNEENKRKPSHDDKRKENHKDVKRKDSHEEHKRKETHEEFKRQESNEENKRKHSHDESKRKENHDEIRRQESNEEIRRKDSHEELKRKDSHEDTKKSTHEELKRKDSHEDNKRSTHEELKRKDSHDDNKRNNHEDLKRKDSHDDSKRNNHEELKRKDSHDESKRKHNHDEVKRQESNEESKRKHNHDEIKRKDSHDESRRREAHQDDHRKKESNEDKRKDMIVEDTKKREHDEIKKKDSDEKRKENFDEKRKEIVDEHHKRKDHEERHIRDTQEKESHSHSQKHNPHNKDRDESKHEHNTQKKKENSEDSSRLKRKDSEHHHHDKKKESEKERRKERYSLDSSETVIKKEPDTTEKKKEFDMFKVERKRSYDNLDKTKKEDSTNVDRKETSFIENISDAEESVDRGNHLRKDVRKEKWPATVGCKRRLSSQDSLDTSLDDTKRMKPERRDSKDSKDSNKSSTSLSSSSSSQDKKKHADRDKHQKNVAKMLEEKIKEDKEKEAHTKPKKEEKENDENDSPKGRKDKKNSESVNKTSESESSDKKRRIKSVRENGLTTCSESETGSCDDGSKKHSIFDIVDDTPPYISMYDKVKARSCKNMQKHVEEKKQEKIKEKFSQLKQSRAKREEKKRSTSCDEDTDSERGRRNCKMITSSEDDIASEYDNKSKNKKTSIMSETSDDDIVKSIIKSKQKNKSRLFRSEDSEMDTTQDSLLSFMKTELKPEESNTTNTQVVKETSKHRKSEEKDNRDEIIVNKASVDTDSEPHGKKKSHRKKEKRQKSLDSSLSCNDVGKKEKHKKERRKSHNHDSDGSGKHGKSRKKKNNKKEVKLETSIFDPLSDDSGTHIIQNNSPNNTSKWQVGQVFSDSDSESEMARILEKKRRQRKSRELDEAGKALEAKLLDETDHFDATSVLVEKVKKKKKKKKKHHNHHKQRNSEHEEGGDGDDEDEEVRSTENKATPSITSQCLSSLLESPPLSVAAANKKPDIPGFALPMDENMHDSAVKSISECEDLPAVNKLPEPEPTPVEEKPTVVISQEETEDAVAALLGDSFGGDFEDYNLEENKPGSPDNISEPDLQIDTDTEDTFDTLDFSKPPRTPDYQHFDNILVKDKKSPGLMLPKTPDIKPVVDLPKKINSEVKTEPIVTEPVIVKPELKLPPLRPFDTLKPDEKPSSVSTMVSRVYPPNTPKTSTVLFTEQSLMKHNKTTELLSHSKPITSLEQSIHKTVNLMDQYINKSPKAPPTKQQENMLFKPNNIMQPFANKPVVLSEQLKNIQKSDLMKNCIVPSEHLHHKAILSVAKPLVSDVKPQSVITLNKSIVAPSSLPDLTKPSSIETSSVQSVPVITTEQTIKLKDNILPKAKIFSHLIHTIDKTILKDTKVDKQPVVNSLSTKTEEHPHPVTIKEEDLIAKQKLEKLYSNIQPDKYQFGNKTLTITDHNYVVNSCPPPPVVENPASELTHKTETAEKPVVAQKPELPLKSESPQKSEVHKQTEVAFRSELPQKQDGAHKIEPVHKLEEHKPEPAFKLELTQKPEVAGKAESSLKPEVVSKPTDEADKIEVLPKLEPASKPEDSQKPEVSPKSDVVQKPDVVHKPIVVEKTEDPKPEPKIVKFVEELEQKLKEEKQNLHRAMEESRKSHLDMLEEDMKHKKEDPIIAPLTPKMEEKSAIFVSPGESSCEPKDVEAAQTRKELLDEIKGKLGYQ